MSMLEGRTGMHFRRYAALAIPMTIRRALMHPFYLAHWQLDASELPEDDDLATWEELYKDLPCVNRSHLEDGISPLLDEGDSVRVVYHSSGTTGRHVYRYHSQTEFSLAAAVRSVQVKPDAPRALGLRLAAPFHGTSAGAQSEPGVPYMFEGAVWEDYFLHSALKMLRHRHDVPGLQSQISFIQGPVQFVRVLTQALRDLDVDASTLGVRAVGVYGGFLSSESRAHIEGYWGFSVLNRYSLSELSGGATVCPRCGHLEFDPQVLPTVLENRVARLAEPRVGELVLTDLYPHSYCQPLVKYRTGDLVEYLRQDNACCAEHVGGIKHVGRVAHSVWDGTSSRMLLGSMELREALYCSEVKKTCALPHLMSLKDRSKLGYPLGSATISGEEVMVSFHPERDFTDRAAVDAVRRRLLFASASLRAAVESGNVGLKVVSNVTEMSELTK